MTTPGPRPAPGDEALEFEITHSQRLCDGFRPLDRLSVTHASLTGRGSLTVQREVLRGGTAVVAIPYDPSRDEIVAIRQFRIGAALATPYAAALELPAGLVDAGETPPDAAARELFEETGLRPRACEEVFAILPSPGAFDERAVFFLVIVDASDLGARAGLADEQEDIVPLALGVDALVAAADEGRIANGFLFASLQWFARKGRERASRLAASDPLSARPAA